MNRKLMEFRRVNNLTVEKISKKLGVSSSYYYKIEQGTRNPSYNFLIRFKKAFNFDVNIFFEKQLDDL